MNKPTPVTPVTEINSIKSRLNTIERNRQFFVETGKDNVNVSFVGDSGLETGEEFELRSTSIRPIFEAFFYRLHLEFEQATPEYISFDIMVDDVRVKRIHVPEGVRHTKHSFGYFVVPTTKTLTLKSDVFPSGSGIVDVTLVGTSKDVVNQTGQLSFGE